MAKYCRKCGVKLISGQNIHPSQEKQYNWICKKCQRKEVKEWEQQNRVRLRATQRKWDKKNRGKGTLRYKKRLGQRRVSNGNRRKAILERFGNRCLFGEHPWHLRFHNKKGLEHASWKDAEKNPQDYALICEACHRHVHWCYKTLHFSWKEIMAFYKAKEEFYLQAPTYLADQKPLARWKNRIP